MKTIKLHRQARDYILQLYRHRPVKEAAKEAGCSQGMASLRYRILGIRRPHDHRCKA